MREVGTFEAKNTLGKLLDRVQEGEAPHVVGIDRSKAQAAAERIRARAGSLRAGKFNWDALKVDRDAGRP